MRAVEPVRARALAAPRHLAPSWSRGAWLLGSCVVARGTMPGRPPLEGCPLMEERRAGRWNHHELQAPQSRSDLLMRPAI